jgi:hypothetical protein
MNSRHLKLGVAAVAVGAAVAITVLEKKRRDIVREREEQLKQYLKSLKTQ